MTPFAPSTASTPTYALLIGVDDYRAFDPSGDNDLLGAVADAQAWEQVCTGHLGLNAEQLRVLPNATRQQILAGLQWLHDQAGEGSNTLITFSGHGVGMPVAPGVEQGMSLALCPSDVQDLVASQLITAKDVYEILGEELLQRTTFFLDTCYSRKQGLKARGLGLLRAAQTLLDLDRGFSPEHALGRIFLSSHLGTPSYEVQTPTGWRGAFSASAQELMVRWTTARAPVSGVTYLRVSHDQLLFRVREQLAVLGISQAPAFISKQARDILLPLLRPGSLLVPGQTSDTPDMALKGEEMSPGTLGVMGSHPWNVVVFSLRIKKDTHYVSLGYCVLPVNAPPAGKKYANEYEANKAYWSFNKALIKEVISGISDLYILGEYRSVWRDEMPEIEAARSLTQQCGGVVQTSPTWSVTSTTTPLHNTSSGNVFYTKIFEANDSGGTAFGMELSWGNNSVNDDYCKVKAVYFYRKTHQQTLTLIDIYPEPGTVHTLSAVESHNGWYYSTDQF